jgi:exodeoxyribonuclease X
MGDVVTCYSLLKLMAQETNTDLEGLMRMSRKHIPLSSLMPFGKHKGTALSELPMSYVQWLLTSTDNLDPDLREALATR